MRNWYARTPEIVETEDGLVHVAWESAKALEEGKLTIPPVQNRVRISLCWWAFQMTCNNLTVNNLLPDLRIFAYSRVVSFMVDRNCIAGGKQPIFAQLWPTFPCETYI